MFDTHERLIGILPYIFGIPSYSVFVCLGIILGIAYYLSNIKRNGVQSTGGIAIVAAGLIFGMIGSKIPLLFESNNIVAIVYGKSIVGGILGGMFGVILVKKILKIKLKMGNIIAPAIALGMSIGRIGCFLNGCCYSIAAKYGFDFGDGMLRLPTQLFEVVFHFTAFLLLNYYKDKVKTPGILFKLYVICYFSFRFFIEFIRENPRIWLNMSIYQIICLIGICYMSIMIIRGLRHE